MNSLTSLIKKKDKITKRLSVGFFLINLFVYILVGWGLYQNKIKYEKQIAVDTQNLAQSLEINIAGVIDKTDNALRGITDEINRQLSVGDPGRSRVNGPELSRYFQQQIEQNPNLDGLRFADNKGNVLFGTNFPVGKTFFIADRDYFKQLASDPQAGLFISAPALGRISGKWVIFIARRVNKPDGAFFGVVFGVVPLNYFSRLFSSLHVGKHALMTIRDGDLGVILRVPEVTDPVREKGSKVLSREFMATLKANPNYGSYEAVVPVDGIRRSYTYRKVGNYPMYLFVGQASADYLDPWWKEFTFGLLLMGMFTGISFFSAITSHRRHQAEVTAFEQLKDSNAQLMRSETKFRTLFDSSRDAVILFALDGFVDCNDETLVLFGCDSKDQFMAGSMSDLLSPLRQPCGTESPVLMKRWVSAAIEMGSVRFEWIHQRLDNAAVFPVEILLSSMELDGKSIVQGVIRDISKRKQVEEALRIAATAFESHEGMFITDANRVILRVNRAFTRIMGYSGEDAVGQTPKLFSSGRHGESFFTTLDEAIKRMHEWQGEIWNRRKNGQIFPGWLTITAVKDDMGVITNYVATLTDITARKSAEDEINNLAYYDPLTRLPNRRLLFDRLKQCQSSSARHGYYAALLLIDLDNFKTLNDTYGHDIGDVLLQQVAQNLILCVRDGDTVARLGGDEFIVILEKLSPDIQEASKITEKIGKAVLESLQTTYLIGNMEHRSTASIGATLFTGGHTSLDDLMKQADLSMYKAKETGRNALRFFDPVMQTIIRERSTLEAGLRNAIKEQEFFLHYQPQVVEAGRVIGVEVLVRWMHPMRGMISPLEFIPLAEETGLILPIGNWVLETACLRLKLWEEQPEMRQITIAVNVSAKQIRESDFVEKVLETLSRTGANPGKLKLELTETLLVENIDDIIQKMNALKEIGVGFSLDDFGTGFSSLSYLKRLPLDQLKIDRSFVRDILVDPNDAAIARTIIALAETLGLEVIAEGVETEAQRDFLSSQGCHAYQGYLFSRPLPLNEFENFVKKSLSELRKHHPDQAEAQPGAKLISQLLPQLSPHMRRESDVETVDHP